MTDQTSRVWRIDVTAWGVVYALGTEAEAEEYRAHKARWEQCVARKRLAAPDEIENHRGTIRSLKELNG